MVSKTIRVWALYRPNDRQDQACEDPGLELEGFATVRDATRILGRRFALGNGTAYFVHPDRQADRDWTEWPDADKFSAYALVWLGPDYIGNEPDATSAPMERWRAQGLLGVERTRY